MTGEDALARALSSLTPAASTEREQAAVPAVEPTGDAAVDAAVQAVASVAGAPPAEALPRYEAAHRALRDALSGIDEH